MFFHLALCAASNRRLHWSRGGLRAGASEDWGEGVAGVGERVQSLGKKRRRGSVRREAGAGEQGEKEAVEELESQ